MRKDRLAPVITFDGTSASGKGTISQLVAKSLGWHILESGALYRVAALSAKQQGILPAEAEKLTQLVSDMDVIFQIAINQGETDYILLDGKEVSGLIRTDQISSFASQIAEIPSLREALLVRQRELRKQPGLVADGRDMGTRVFPDAPLKFYIDAQVDIRAKRRFMQLKVSHPDVTLDGILEKLKMRDSRDKKRAVAPLKPAEDAIIIDTSDLDIGAVFSKVMDIVTKRGFQAKSS